jgi:hypothetical protein
MLSPILPPLLRLVQPSQRLGADGAKLEIRAGMEESLYLERMAEFFYGLIAEGRGDGARGRNFHILHVLNFVWSEPRLSLHRYRPSRNPGAFLAMAFDLLGDYLCGHGERLLEDQPHLVLPIIKSWLGLPWHAFRKRAIVAGLPYLAAVLDETVRVALRTPSKSSFPAYLKRLRLYMTPAQLARLDVNALIDRLPVGKILFYLRFTALPVREPGDERHPIGGDLRKAIRKTFDLAWRRALERQEKHDLVTFFAGLPVDGLRLLSSDDDFAVFYARLTDGREPGRIWQAPALYVEEDWQHFLFLTGRLDRLTRRELGLSRLGLSTTFPETIRYLDGLLEHAAGFPELHARRPWREAVESHKDRITQARLRFVEALAQELRGGDHHDQL